jgi:hypothetical protein
VSLVRHGAGQSNFLALGNSNLSRFCPSLVPGRESCYSNYRLWEFFYFNITDRSTFFHESSLSLFSDLSLRTIEETPELGSGYYQCSDRTGIRASASRHFLSGLSVCASLTGSSEDISTAIPTADRNATRRPTGPLCFLRASP